jgi:hypothetical protein
MWVALSLFWYRARQLVAATAQDAGKNSAMGESIVGWKKIGRQEGRKLRKKYREK